jgi:hypothetical protein
MGTLQAAIAAAAAGSPMVMTRSEGRVLLVDGDAAAYRCSGNDDCSPGQARHNLQELIRSAASIAGCGSVRVLVTSRGSHKGHRYAVARVKPYQGQRSSGRRPKNWEFLRQILENGDHGYPTEITSIAEADDLFGRFINEFGPENVVSHYDDKDMRMNPGWHLTWKEHHLFYVPPDTFNVVSGDKVYGRKWFWLQMLHGDTADNIPGLPKYKNAKGALALCGPATAEKLLADCVNNTQAFSVVALLYQGFYGEDWWVNMLEQAVLLWMRNDKNSSPLNVLAEGNPLEGCIGASKFYDAGIDAIKMRIAEAQV